MTPPLNPKVKNKSDLSNIDPMFLNENVVSPPKKTRYAVNQSKKIK